MRAVRPRSRRNDDARLRGLNLAGAKEVLAYATNRTAAPPPAPVEAITGLASPAGLAVDRMGNLYVVELVTNGVKVFKPGQVMPFETLLPALGSAAFLSVAVDARGTVYVATSNGSIAVYAKGATSPSNTLSDPAIQSANGIAIDGVGNSLLNYVGLVSSNTLGVRGRSSSGDHEYWRDITNTNTNTNTNGIVAGIATTLRARSNRRTRNRFRNRARLSPVRF
jgi:hypothetical protein